MVLLVISVCLAICHPSFFQFVPSSLSLPSPVVLFRECIGWSPLVVLYLVFFSVNPSQFKGILSLSLESVSHLVYSAPVLLVEVSVLLQIYKIIEGFSCVFSLSSLLVDW